MGLHELELSFRATLELRYRRGLDDETIAAVAQFDREEIQRQRRRALVWLAQRTGTRGPDAIEIVERGLASLTPAAWAGEPEPEAPVDDEPELEPVLAPGPSAAPEIDEPEPEPEHQTEPEPEQPTEVQPPAVSFPPPTSPSGASPIPRPKPFPSSAEEQGTPSSANSRRRLLGLVGSAGGRRRSGRDPHIRW